jgi:hypothetical protein
MLAVSRVLRRQPSGRLPPCQGADEGRAVPEQAKTSPRHDQIRVLMIFAL